MSQPLMEPVFLSLDEVLEIHEQQMVLSIASGGLAKHDVIGVFETRCRAIEGR